MRSRGCRLISFQFILTSGSFMGDIAMPNTNYETEYEIKRNISTQQELEKLKKEVYLEGLQVEEEGLTDVLRKKIKQAISVEDQDSKRQKDKLLNEAIVSVVFAKYVRRSCREWIFVI